MMEKRKLVRVTIAGILGVLFSLFLLCSLVEAKRKAPKEVKPVIYNGIKYTVPHWGWERGWNQNGGYIQAWDIETNKKLWELKVYDIKYNPRLETDVQDVFITSLSINKGNLIVVNERNDIYEIDLETREIKK